MCDSWDALGRVRSDNGESLTLDVELGLKVPDDPAPATCALDKTLHLVRWGDLVFAVPTWRMGLFCVEVTGGERFPMVPFRYVGAEDSFNYQEPTRPAGTPRVPSAYSRLILEHPIECTITSFVDWRELDVSATTTSKVAEGVFLVDVGTEQGVDPSMYFHTSEDRSYRMWWWGDARIEEAGSNSSRVVIGFLNETRADAEQLVGTRMSTLSSRAGDK
jgi:hypothetical protein